MKAEKTVTNYYVGVFLKDGTLCDELGSFDTYKAAEDRMKFEKEFMPEYEYKIIVRKGRVLYEREN